MAMTSIDLDEDALERAREILGTSTKKDTINAALHEVIRVRAAYQLIALLQSDAVEYEDSATLRREAWGYSATGS